MNNDCSLTRAKLSQRKTHWIQRFSRLSVLMQLKFVAGFLAILVAFRVGPAMSENSAATLPPISETVIMLYYKDMAAATAFYQDTLGLEVTFNQDSAKLFRLTPNSVLGVIREGEGAYHQTQATNAVMLSIVTPDVDAWYERLKSVGDITFLKPIANSSTNPIRAFLIEDPGGYTVEFFSWLNSADTEQR